MARPRTTMTDATCEAILRTIKLGLHPERAAQAHGVSPGSMRAHRKRNPEFATAIKEAEAEAERNFLGRIMQHTQRQWTAAAWLLERRFPERWKRQDGTHEVKVTGNVRSEGPPAPAEPKALSDYASLFAAAAASLRLPDQDDEPHDPA
jgi:hypothetical protein